jgi:pimeloyl-ACP methyl ester carboxylesterase
MEKTSPSPVSTPSAFIDVGHSGLAYWKVGRGPDLVFVYGWPLHSATFRNIVPLLADSFTCHLFDLPGTGQSVWGPDSPIDLASHAKTLRRAIDFLGLRRYALLAHDSGGLVARLIAADDPRVTGLVLGDTEIPGHTPWLIVMYSIAAKLGGMAPLRMTLRSRALRRSFLAFGACFHDPSLVDGEFYDLFVAPLLASDTALRGQLRLVETVDFHEVERLPAVHARIAAPSLLLWGKDDPIFPLRKARAMVSQFHGGAELAVIDRASLFVHEERPAEFTALAKPFLLKAFASPRAVAAASPAPAATPAVA